MTRQFFLIAACLFPSLLLAQEINTAPKESSDLKSIFNGKDLNGWDGDPTLWSVKDGVIHGETTAENPRRLSAGRLGGRDRAADCLAHGRGS